MAFTPTDKQAKSVAQSIGTGVPAQKETGTLTAQDTQTLAGDTYALADEGAVIINNRTRIAEIEGILDRLGYLKSA